MSIKNDKQLNRIFGEVIAIGMMSIFLMPSFASAQGSSGAIQEKQIVENNKNFKNAIEENQKLIARSQELEAEMEKLRSQNEENTMQFDDLKRQRDELSRQIDSVRSSNRKYAQEINKLEQKVEDLESTQKELEVKAEMAEDTNKRVAAQSASEGNDTPTVGANTEQVLSLEQKTIDLLSRIDAFNEQDEKLRGDAAKAHYNMGNIYFEKGEYEIAAREYYQAVTLMPNDPDAHYNLAFVSSQYLNDYKTALEHYKMYLYLKPDAQDRDQIKEKIVQAQLVLQSKVDSPLDKTK